jgi:hypothetical protein
VLALLRAAGRRPLEPLGSRLVKFAGRLYLYVLMSLALLRASF